MGVEGRRGALCLALACVMGLLLAGCASTGDYNARGVAYSPPPDGTNAPVQGGVNVAPGSEEDFMVNVGRRTFFAQGSADLDETARVTLDKQAQWLAQYPNWKIKLQGFSDDPGSPAAQKSLSQRRAEAVRDYLASRGVAPDRMLAKGYGRDRLVADCTDISCKSQNRRVITNPQENADSAAAVQ
jgi:peptidoglycan-associated lipoprotein